MFFVFVLEHFQFATGIKLDGFKMEILVPDNDIHDDEDHRGDDDYFKDDDDFWYYQHDGYGYGFNDDYWNGCDYLKDDDDSRYYHYDD